MFSMKYSVLCSNVVVRYAVIVRNLYKMESASKVTSSERKKIIKPPSTNVIL